MRRRRSFAGGATGLLSSGDRRRLLRAFAEVDHHVPSAHSPGELLFLCEKVLQLDVPGDIIECGTFKGGSAAKLSLVARVAGRRLFVCDSFKGLPDNVEAQSYHRTDGVQRTFKGGAYDGTLEEVRANIRKWGAIEVCNFVEGFFEYSLPGLEVMPAVVFMDVDYVTSALECLRWLWPRLVPGGYFFTHEAGLVEFVNGICDGAWWHTHLGQCPPVLYGAGYGVESLAPYLAYFQKAIER